MNWLLQNHVVLAVMAGLAGAVVGYAYRRRIEARESFNSTSMTELPVTKVELLSSGQIAITPQQPSASFQHIYRAALGVEWNNDKGQFLSPSEYMLSSRKNYSPVQHAGQLVEALKDEMGLCPRCTPETQWVGIGEELRERIVRMFAGSTQ